MSVRVIQGDSREILPTLEAGSIDAVVTDPPYALESIRKRFGKTDPSYQPKTTSGPHVRAARGFMGHEWDTGETAFDPAFWTDVLRVMKPGAYALVFNGSRTFHRCAIALEDAGFILHPFIGWIFGTGFPKATKVKDSEWEGWRYGTQSLKPAIEPILMAQKPFSEKNGTANVLEHGTGAINIDGCRIGTREPRELNRSASIGFGGSDGQGVIIDGGAGRWPANVILSYPEDEYLLRPNVTTEEKQRLYRWMSENT